jgi:chemotaxis protein histidine kinase CheA
VADFDPSTAPEVIALFATEAGERMSRLTACLDDLAGGDADVLEGCRREAHTLKGTAAMMGFVEVAESARRLEALLGTDRVHSLLDVEAIRAEVSTLAGRVAAAITPSD